MTRATRTLGGAVWAGGAAIGGTFACGHTEAATNGDTRALPPAADRALVSTDAPSDGAIATSEAGADAATLVPPSAGREGPDANPGLAARGAVLAVGAEDVADAGPAVRCRDDIKVPEGVVVRLALHTRPRRPGESPGTPYWLTLEIPSIGFGQEMCRAGTADPFNMGSSKQGPNDAKFFCATAFLSSSGTVHVADGVLQVQYDSPKDDLFHEGPRGVRQTPPRLIPLPCGARVEIDAKGRAYVMGDGVLRTSSW